jgi:4-hydroxybutyrate dehydrogenase
VKPIATFSFPTTTIVGPGVLADIGAQLKNLGVRRPLIVTDPGLIETPAFQLLADHLNNCIGEAAYNIFSGVTPNPKESNVYDGAQTFRALESDGIIGFGGGSAMDVAKAIRLKLNDPTLRIANFDFDADWSNLAPCICIPTTAGTGSEVGRSSVITIEATKRKAVLFHPSLLADVVFLDAEVTVGLPPRLTAATGIDALTHCIESFTSPVYQPYCDGVALEGVRLVAEFLPKAVSDGSNLDARTQMLVAAAMGAIAFQKDLGATHSMAHPLSTHRNIHHGMANAICLEEVMKFNSKGKPGLYRRVGMACGLDIVTCSDQEADQKTIEFVANLIQQTGIKKGLKNHGVEDTDIPTLVKEAIEDPCYQTNPIPVSKSDFTSLYLACL